MGCENRILPIHKTEYKNSEYLEKVNRGHSRIDRKAIRDKKPGD